MLNRKHAALLRDTSGRADTNDQTPGNKLVIGKRQILFHAREPAPSIYEVLSGAFMIFRLLADGRRQIVSLALPGSLCGFSRENVHECSGEALVASTVLAYDRAVLAGSDKTASRLSHMMEQQICALAEHIVMLGRRTTEERLAAFLIECADIWRTGSDDNAIVFRIPMTRVEIGDYLGMSLETVSRGIAEFERRGLIRTGGRQGEMRVYDVAALATAWRSQRKIRKHAN
jgi:CRP-like cAMP-binding protein